MIVTIDGPAASGKSTAARLLAKRLGVCHLDTGAMYRAVTWAGLQRGVRLDDKQALAELTCRLRIELVPDGSSAAAGSVGKTATGSAGKAAASAGGVSIAASGFPVLQVLVDGQDVTEAIRANEISRQTHYAASNELVRGCLVTAQQEFGRRWGDLVTEGRDQGTVVFPRAALKVYLDADETVRAARRQNELAAKGTEVPLAQVLEEIRQRDKSDRSRAVGPLRAAEDAVILDTSGLTIEQVVDRLAALVAARMQGG